MLHWDLPSARRGTEQPGKTKRAVAEEQPPSSPSLEGRVRQLPGAGVVRHRLLDVGKEQLHLLQAGEWAGRRRGLSTEQPKQPRRRGAGAGPPGAAPASRSPPPPKGLKERLAAEEIQQKRGRAWAKKAMSLEGSPDASAAACTGAASIANAPPSMAAASAAVTGGRLQGAVGAGSRVCEPSSKAAQRSGERQRRSSERWRGRWPRQAALRHAPACMHLRQSLPALERGAGAACAPVECSGFVGGRATASEAEPALVAKK